QAKAAGIQQGLHNEEFELTTVDGQRTYDLLFELLRPELVKFQFQVSTIRQGYDAAEYFTKYPGRFISMHVQGWSANTRKIMPVGQDTLDWKKIFTAARMGGIRNYFVEMNLDMMGASVPYLRGLQVGATAPMPGVPTKTGEPFGSPFESGRRDLNPRPPEPHGVDSSGESRQNVATTRCSGHRCCESDPEDRPGIAAESQQNSQQD